MNKIVDEAGRKITNPAEILKKQAGFYLKIIHL